MKPPYTIRIERHSLQSSSTKKVELSCDSHQSILIREGTGVIPSPREEHRSAERIYHSAICSLIRWQFWEQRHFTSPLPYSDGVIYRFVAIDNDAVEAKLTVINPDETAPRSIHRLRKLADRLLGAPAWVLTLRGYIGFDIYIPYQTRSCHS